LTVEVFEGSSEICKWVNIVGQLPTSIDQIRIISLKIHRQFKKVKFAKFARPQVDGFEFFFGRLFLCHSREQFSKIINFILAIMTNFEDQHCTKNHPKMKTFRTRSNKLKLVVVLLRFRVVITNRSTTALSSCYFTNKKF
jgi:hypothetical protein